MVDDIIIAAMAAAEESRSEAVDEPAGAAERPPQDLMLNFSLGDDDSQSQGSRDSSEIPKKRKRRLVANVAVTLEMPEKKVRREVSRFHRRSPVAVLRRVYDAPRCQEGLVIF